MRNNDKQLANCLIRTIDEKAGPKGVKATTVVSSVGEKLDIPAVDVREAIWRLADSQEIEFTEDRLLKLPSTHS